MSEEDYARETGNMGNNSSESDTREKDTRRNIIICCDGTGNQLCDHNTNVVRLFQMAQKNCPEQIAYYDPGVGTLGSRAAVTWLMKKVTWLLGLAFGLGMTRNIEEAYEFLMNNYRGPDKDRVFLFGFSRGAYTVRAIGGLLAKCDLLHPNSKNQIPYALDMYRNKKVKSDGVEATEFRKTFSRECVPYFIGVWDTVKSTGPLRSYDFSDHVLNEKVPNAYHAMAIDEKRYMFKCLPWEKSKDPKNQTIEQVWFSGVHCDVGGSYERKGLSEIALEWMVDKAKDCGLLMESETYDPKCDEKPNKSWRGFWKLWFIPSHRPVKAGDKIHKCTYVRKEKRDDYKPHNLPRLEEITPIGDDSDCEKKDN